MTLSENVISGQELNHKTHIHTFVVLLNHVLSYTQSPAAHNLWLDSLYTYKVVNIFNCLHVCILLVK